jgi:hypothetical protein
VLRFSLRPSAAVVQSAGAKMRYEERERSDLRTHERKKCIQVACVQRFEQAAAAARVRMCKKAHPKLDAAAGLM